MWFQVHANVQGSNFSGQQELATATWNICHPGHSLPISCQVQQCIYPVPDLAHSKSLATRLSTAVWLPSCSNSIQIFRLLHFRRGRSRWPTPKHIDELQYASAPSTCQPFIVNVIDIVTFSWLAMSAQCALKAWRMPSRSCKASPRIHGQALPSSSFEFQ